MALGLILCLILILTVAAVLWSYQYLTIQNFELECAVRSALSAAVKDGTLETYLQKSFEEYEERVLIPNAGSDVPILDQLSAFLMFAQGLPHEGGREFLRVATIYMLRDEVGDAAYNYILNPSRPYARICRQLIEEGQKRGEIRADKTPEELFDLISIFSNGIDQLCYMSREEVSVLETYSGALQDFVRRMMAA